MRTTSQKCLFFLMVSRAARVSVCCCSSSTTRSCCDGMPSSSSVCSTSVGMSSISCTIVPCSSRAFTASSATTRAGERVKHTDYGKLNNLIRARRQTRKCPAPNWICTRPPPRVCCIVFFPTRLFTQEGVLEIGLCDVCAMTLLINEGWTSLSHVHANVTLIFVIDNFVFVYSSFESTFDHLPNYF